VSGLERVWAVNHTKKEIMAVGHEAWGGSDALSTQDRLDIFAPNTQAGREQFFYLAKRFGVEELKRESDTQALNYKRINGFWESGVVT
jgi:hypothetical protein